MKELNPMVIYLSRALWSSCSLCHIVATVARRDYECVHLIHLGIVLIDFFSPSFSVSGLFSIMREEGGNFTLYAISYPLH